jgi:enterochelin esterase-like enzyme
MYRGGVPDSPPPRRLTRRQALIGAAGLVAAGAGAAALVVDPRSVYRRLTRDCGSEPPAPPRSGARVTERTLHSRVLGKAVGYAVALPPGARSGAGLPVCLCLPGRGGTGAGALAGLHAPDALAQAIAERGVRPFALVAVDGGESYWHHRAGGEDRLAMLLDEIVPLCTGTLGLGPARALMGWSMGGYGALLAAETRPRTFSAVAVSSPAVWRSRAEQRDAVPDAFDGDADFAAHDVIAHAARLRGLAVRIDCGNDDPFAPGVRRLIASCPAPPAGGFAVGCHEARFWRRVLPAQIDFIGAALA